MGHLFKKISDGKFCFVDTSLASSVAQFTVKVTILGTFHKVFMKLSVDHWNFQVVHLDHVENHWFKVNGIRFFHTVSAMCFFIFLSQP